MEVLSEFCRESVSSPKEWLRERQRETRRDRERKSDRGSREDRQEATGRQNGSARSLRSPNRCSPSLANPGIYIYVYVHVYVYMSSPKGFLIVICFLRCHCGGLSAAVPNIYLSIGFGALSWLWARWWTEETALLCRPRFRATCSGLAPLATLSQRLSPTARLSYGATRRKNVGPRPHTWLYIVFLFSVLSLSLSILVYFLRTFSQSVFFPAYSLSLSIFVFANFLSIRPGEDLHFIYLWFVVIAVVIIFINIVVLFVLSLLWLFSIHIVWEERVLLYFWEERVCLYFEKVRVLLYVWEKRVLSYVLTDLFSRLWSLMFVVPHLNTFCCLRVVVFFSCMFETDLFLFLCFFCVLFCGGNGAAPHNVLNILQEKIHIRTTQTESEFKTYFRKKTARSR